MVSMTREVRTHRYPILLALIALAFAVVWNLLPANLVPIDQAVRLIVGSGVAFIGCIGALFWWWRIDYHYLRQDTDQLQQQFSDVEQALSDINESVRLFGEQHPKEVESSDAIRGELRVLQTLLAQVAQTGRARPRTADHVDPLMPVAPPEPEARMLTIMRSAIEDSRVDLYLQPIVRLPNRKTIHYEAFSRVRDEQGLVIFPLDYLAPATDAGLVATLDNLLLFRCINLIRKLGPRRPNTRIFVNLASGSLHDPAFMRDFVGFMTGHHALAERLVFEIAGDVLHELPADISAQLGQLARAGFPFSIDQVTDLNLDLTQLARYNVQFVKVEAKRLLEAAEQGDHFLFRDILTRANISLIATHIETEATVVEILELGIAHGQGYLFGPPKPSRQDFDHHENTQAEATKPIAA